MNLIVITHPDVLSKEEEMIVALFEAGLQRLHLRKPTCTEIEVESLLRRIPGEYHSRIVLHDHHMLALRYPLGGIHLNGRNPEKPEGYTGRISCSCHSFAEVKEKKEKGNYLFVSPVFNSISKQVYHSAYTDSMLREASHAGIIDHRVYALGGVTPERMDYLKDIGFGGVAVLGTIWAQPVIEAVEASFKRFLQK